MAKVILICGKICSGKSYYANELKKKENAVILSTDEVTYDLTENEQGENYDRFAQKVQKYLMKKTVEFVKTGCNIILDWGFWNHIERKSITDYFTLNNIKTEWHYIDIDDDEWEKNIIKRNRRITEGKNHSDFYINEDLQKKMLSKWEKPDTSEIDIWYQFSRSGFSE